MKLAKWRIWYDDGLAAEGSTVEEWEAAPAENVIYAMAFFDDGTAAHLTGHDIVWMRDFGEGVVVASDNDRDGLLRRMPFVKWGRWTTMEKYVAAQREAEQAADAWHKERGEYRGCCP